MSRVHSTDDAVLGEVEIDAPPERVFEALITPSQLKQWWFEPAVAPCYAWEIDLRVGGLWRAEWRGADKTYVANGKVLELEAPRVFAYSWSGDWVEHKDTVVRWELKAVAGGTHLKLSHSGLRKYKAALADLSQGWPGVLDKINAYVMQRAAEKSKTAV